jgi:hypothetical protein
MRRRTQPTDQHYTYVRASRDFFDPMNLPVVKLALEKEHLSRSDWHRLFTDLYHHITVTLTVHPSTAEREVYEAMLAAVIAERIKRGWA